MIQCRGASSIDLKDPFRIVKFSFATIECLDTLTPICFFTFKETKENLKEPLSALTKERHSF